ncbi:ribbon-helix-helix protein, CopG family [Haloferula sargassicola]|uniref:Ribbon-helix-helix protein CopG domain-containing protein n=1 Tax=Haloferula sargassicola TaxID=490096 RepID=A0ABP9UPT3_9BACT
MSTLKRTSMALDAESLDTLEQLSRSWDVSKAEVIRRALRSSKEADDNAKPPRRTPLEALMWLRENGISREEAEAFKAEIGAERMARRDPWERHAAP